MKLEYTELEELVQRYQQGETEAAQRILDAFQAFLSNYHRLICFGQVDIHNAGVRNFIGLFKKKGSSNIHQGKHHPGIRAGIYHTAQMIKDCFKELSTEDVEQELILALFTMAKRYRTRNNEPRFHLYMQRAFYYQIYRQLKRYSMKAHVSLDEENTQGNEYIDIDKFTDDNIFSTVENVFEDELDENWVSGFTCSETFTKLTPFERKILRWYYIDEKSDGEIGEKIGMSRSSVWRKRVATKRKIADACKERDHL